LKDDFMNWMSKEFWWVLGIAVFAIFWGVIRFIQWRMVRRVKHKYDKSEYELANGREKPKHFKYTWDGVFGFLFFAAISGICFFIYYNRDPGGVVEYSSDFASSIPCWEQSWESGEWSPLLRDPNAYVFSWEALDLGDGKHLSVCRKCDSDRLMDSKGKKVKIILSSEPYAKDCNHEWVAGWGRKSSDLIEAGDVVAVQQRQRLFIFMIQEISGASLDDQEVTYKVAKFNLKGKCPIKIDLSKMGWKEKTARNLPTYKGGIEFYLFRIDWTNNEPKFIIILYDLIYGGFCGYDHLVAGNDIAKIAVIHKDDMKTSSIIDFRQYRFKSWEDGLGNKCE
jgi:hypothetical protein